MKRNLIIAMCVLVWWGCTIGEVMLYGLGAMGLAYVAACAAAVVVALLTLDWK